MGSRRNALRLVVGAVLLLSVTACGERAAKTPEAGAQGAIDRSVADIRAAEAAAREPAEISRSVGELTAAKSNRNDAPDAKAR